MRRLSIKMWHRGLNSLDPPARQEAATTVISLQQVAEIRFKTMTVMFERQVIRPLGNMLLKLNGMYMGPEKQVRIIGREDAMEYMQPQYEMITPADIVTNPDIYAVGASVDPSISKQMQLESLMQWMGIVGSNPQLMMNPMYGIDWGVIIEELPYLLNLKLKRPLVLPFNPQLGYQEAQNEQALADQMMMQQMGMAMQPPPPPGGEEGGEELPSRVKGELKKKEEKEGGEETNTAE